jgi:DNA-binding response OmpR family regulator
MRRRVLVVDDDASVRGMVRAVLEHAGYEVTAASNGCEAIACLASSDYDVVLLDVAMPKLSGIAVVGRLQKENSAILAHTYLLTTDQPSDLAELPVCGIISKPFDMQTLLAETKDCIGH